ncbi:MULTISPECIES: twin-arginine translocase TatA/TatE family subunit [Shimazuella]|jgi:sec-independent protein translocase protein TatA|uniref:Sec-independent protein translocase protein TatA n=1 Tax=Shimazuella alba TaxID=2690964 RepID=A0A6I4VQN8_9BACL|nr:MULTISPECIES: twin-arginine translocase TatA/TatE family subunit [Shimazuella]MXQ53967.1 twin-arginine translocase TatA/TatE family subunit [Shimazuella alba]
MGINGFEWILIVIVALLLFGPKKLPELGKAVGKSFREFKNGMSGVLDDEEKKVTKSEANKGN